MTNSKSNNYFHDSPTDNKYLLKTILSSTIYPIFFVLYILYKASEFI